MYTYSVISQRSPVWFYFLLKPTSLHTASTTPILAIQNVHSDCRTSQDIYSLDADLPLLFHVSRSNIYHWASSMFCFDPWKKEKSLFIVLALENHEGRGTIIFNGVARKWHWDNQLKIANRKTAPKQLFSPNCDNMSTYWHVQKLGGQEGKILIQVEEDTQTSSFTFENICFKFTAYTLWHSLIYAESSWRSGPF